MSHDDTEALLKGTTWKVYKYVLENGPTGIREIQKSLRLSTPSLVLYHLNKLEQEGINKKELSRRMSRDTRRAKFCYETASKSENC